MKNIFKIVFLAFVSMLIVNVSFAEKYLGEINKPKPTIKQTKAEPCKPATGSTDLDINNVRARINTGGDMWWDFTQAKYEIPRGSRKTSMFAAALWIGGLDINKQLKLAAQRFRSGGVDFFTGPLTQNGTAAVDAETCNEWDRHFKITRREVEEFIADNSKATDVIKNWPSSGNKSKGQTGYLAPFFDKNGNYEYEWDQGEYPYYDLNNSLCPTNTDKKNPDGTWKPLEPTYETTEGTGNPKVKGGILVDQVLKGDLTLWWVFNDKGNIHLESNGDPIGLEIRAQAFGFSTNDEINNMTFYTYEIINRSTYTLTETYFSQWVDTDLGYAFDDYVGCDVQRGLGYSYNGRATDGAGQYYAYEGNPPAIGVDFFQGPYMDPDGLDNPKYKTDGSQICDVSINGVNFGNGLIDDERFGMRRFLYYNNSSGPTGEPEAAMDYYNYLKGIWRDNSKMKYGGDGHGTGNNATQVPADFMFPGDSDPLHWGTGCGADPIPGKIWTEETANNAPSDRRFMQSAGPFTLKPGAVNYITVGIPWAKATFGGPFASVELLRTVDDKCQTLFDNCFKVLDGPDAPDLFVKELDKELILYITNVKGSKNYNESYNELDIRIPEKLYKKVPVIDTIIDINGNPVYTTNYVTVIDSSINRYYKFEGYQIYQLRDNTVSIADIENLDKARLVLQCDLKNFDSKGNPIAQLINYKKSDALGGSLVPTEKVNGANNGISHSFTIKEDQFAIGDKRLINHKKYYFIAIAYAYNNFKTFNQSDPEALNGQKEPYLAGRKSRLGEIRPITAIPHNPLSEASGTIINAAYGSSPKIKRIEGHGNGGLTLDLTQASIDELMSKTAPPYIIENPVYQNNKGPINVKVIDPLNVKPGKFTLKFYPTAMTDTINDAMWTVFKYNNGVWDTIVKSDVGIKIANEQIIESLGLSITINQVKDLAIPYIKASGEIIGYQFRDASIIESSLEFSDNKKQWLFGVPDNDGIKAYNWIRSGSVSVGDNATNEEKETEDYYFISNDVIHGNDVKNFLDEKEQFEKILNGTWAPYRLGSFYENGPTYKVSINDNKLINLASVDIVFTSDKSKWTRCPVIELSDDPVLVNGVAKFSLRADPSINKEGIADANEDYPTGMSWFPGYAINVETGERLNIMFGEDSWQSGNNGKDMKWNPTSTFIDGNSMKIVFGGKHYVYILGHNSNIEGSNSNCPSYDKGKWLYARFNSNEKSKVFKNVMWVGLPMVSSQYIFDDPSKIPTDAKIRLRVQKPYKRFYATKTDTATVKQNNNYPMYEFSTDDLATQKGQVDVAKSALELIGVVPNPYYAFSNYEANQLDNRVRIINLPQKCTVTIYTLNGTLIRQFKVDKEGVVSGKGEALTSIDWDLKNYANIPIAGGVYIIHVNADGIGEKVVKWFGALRPTDLNSF